MQRLAHPRSTVEDLAALATRQGGVVAHAQLVALGVLEGAIRHRVRSGRLLPVPGHRGVFFVGHASRSRRTMSWAAQLAIGPASVISHRSAATLWEVRVSASRFVELTVPGPSRRRDAIRVHRTTWLPEEDVTVIDGLRVTRVARTLLDLGAVLPRRAVELAFDRADVLELLDFGDIVRVLQEGASRPGASALRWVAAREAAGSTVTESGLEELVLAIIRRAGLPEPICQLPVLTYRADFCWPAARLIAEADGPWHDTPSGRAHDQRRDEELRRAGWRVLRFPKPVILGEPASVAEAIRAALRDDL